MKKGFTLIEVLIVIIIVGILATLAMPRMQGMVERARVAEAKTTLGALRTMLMADYPDSGDTFPTAIAANTAAVEAELGDIVDDGSALFDYSWAAGDATSITVTATRDATNQAILGDRRAVVTMVVNSSGSSTMSVDWEAIVAP